MAEDQRKEPPEPHETTRLEVVPQWAIEMGKNVTFIRGNVETLAGEFAVLRVDVRSLQQWRLDEERRRDVSLGPPPLTSTRVAAIIDAHPSAMDLNLQAAQAAEIIKNQERDKRIEETHALAAKAADVLAQQSDYMGMGKKGAQWLFSEKGRTAMAQAAAGLVAAYEILKHGGVIK